MKLNLLKKVVFYLVLIIGIASCISRKVTNLIYNPDKMGPKYSFELPSGYTESRISGDNEYSQQYLYKDSLVFYITSFKNTHNYNQIRKQGTYYERFNALAENRTLTLQGTTRDSLYWKDKLLETGITIGYSKVPKDRISEFNQAIISLQKLK